MRILMCRPDYFDIEYEINPWMNIRCKTNSKRAVEQWEKLYKTIESCGAKISLVPPAKGLPDMPFTANAGLLYKGKIILAHFKVIERQGEVAYFNDWFEKAGFKVVNRPGRDQSSYFYEGAGDSLPAGDKLFVGYGFRTERKFYEETSYFDQNKLVYCELVNPYFYHIDTCFCPLNDKQAIWFPNAFSPDSQKRMQAAIELFPVVEDEAKRFACNAVVLDKHIILPSGCPKISATLEKLGLKTHACDMDEYLKAGGACKCLTLRID